MSEPQQLETTDSDFQEEVLQADKPVLAMFWGSWCPVCKRTQPMLKQLWREWGVVKIRSLNIDRNPQIASQYKIAGTPTFYLFVKGETKAMKVGAVTKKQLQDFVRNNLPQPASEES